MSVSAASLARVKLKVIPTVLAEKATQAEADAGVNASKYMTPATTKQQADARLASQPEAEAGSNNTKTMTPFRAAQQIGFNLGITRAQIATRYIPLTGFFVTGETATGDVGMGALYVRGTSGGLRAIQDAFGTWWNLSVVGKANVAHFGAKIDGSTDDGPPVQAAVNYISGLTFGGCVYFPTGRCKIITQVKIPKNYGNTVFISGDGYGSVVLVGDVPGGKSALVVGNDGTPSRANYVFENIAFIGGGTVGKAVHLMHASGTRFNKVWFNYMRTAISAEDSFAVRLSGVMMEFIEEYGFASSTACHNLIVDGGCQFLNVTDRIKYPSAGVILAGAQSVNIVVRDNDFETCGPPLLMSGDGHESTIFEGNYVEFCAGVIQSGKQYGLSVRNNQLNDNGNWAFPDCDGATLTNNKVNVMNITFGSGCLNVDVGHNLTGSGSVIGASPWPAPTLANGWTNASGSVPGYKRTAAGLCLLRGRLSSGTLSATAFTLPAGYRPLANIYVPVSGASGWGAGQVLITSDGAVVPVTAGDGVVYLDGISFPIGG